MLVSDMGNFVKINVPGTANVTFHVCLGRWKQNLISSYCLFVQYVFVLRNSGFYFVNAYNALASHVGLMLKYLYIL